MTFVSLHSPPGLSEKKSNLPFTVQLSLAPYIFLCHLTAYSCSCFSLFYLFFLLFFIPRISHVILKKKDFEEERKNYLAVKKKKKEVIAQSKIWSIQALGKKGRCYFNKSSIS